jgi:hypothetical protein
LVERQLWELVVAGSNPVAPTIFFYRRTDAKRLPDSKGWVLEQAITSARMFGRRNGHEPMEDEIREVLSWG